MAQNKQSLSTFPASLSSSFSSSPASSMVPPPTPPPHSGIPGADQLPSPPSTTFKNIFGIPPSGHRPHSSSSTLSMGQVVSRPQLTAPFSPSSAPSSLGVSSSNAGNRFKRAFGGRRKKSDIATPSSAGLDKGNDSEVDELLHGSTSGAVTRHLGAKQLTLQLAQQVFNKKSAPASPALSGLSLPPPLPPKHTPNSSSHLPPINTNIDKRVSVMTASSPIAPALDFMRKSDERTEQVGSRDIERKDLERSETKDTRRKSDSTLSLHTIRPALGNRTPRPVSLASLQSTHTVVPINKRLSALITDADYVMAEEENGTRNDERGRAFSCTSPAPSLRVRDRRSQSLTLGPPLALMVSGPTAANAAMSMETITVTLPRSTSEGRERERLVTRELATTTSASLPMQTTGNTGMRHVNAVSFLNQASNQAILRVERTLPNLPDTPQRTPSPQAQSPSFRQTAISMTSGFAPAAGLARRAVERMGRVWGSKSSFSSPLASPLGESSFNGRSGPPSRASSSQSELSHHAQGRQKRHNPQTPSIASTTSSVSDHEGPWLGKCIRGPVRASALGVVVDGLVFGRELNDCVRETGIDSILNVVRKNVVPDGGEQGNPVQQSRPPASLESRHIPALVVRCVQHIFTWGVQEQGLFRVSGRSSHVGKLRSEFDTGADFDIAQCNPGDLDPHAVASVFKAYLRELPESILTNELLPYFDAALASERSNNGVQDPPPLETLHRLRKPPSLSTLGMPNFSDARPPSESLRATFSSLISRLPQANRDLLLTVIEVINQTASRSSETKMPLSNLLLVLRPSLKMNPSLLQALCESQDIWSGVNSCKEVPDLDVTAGETTQSSTGLSEFGVLQKRDGVEVALPVRSSSDNKRYVRPLPSLPLPDDSTSSSPSESFGPSARGNSGASHSALDAETSSSSFSATDDSSSISHLSQGGRPVTPTSLNFKLLNPRSPPSLSCSTDSLSATSSSDSPMQLVKPLALVDEGSEQHSANSPHSLRVAEPIPLPIPSRPSQTASEPRFQFPGPRDSVVRNPLAHRKSTPSVSFSSSISAEARAASMASRARRLKKPSLHLLFSKHCPSAVSSSPSHSPVISGPLLLQDGALRSSYASDSSPDSMVTAPSRFSYPPVLNTAIDESSISLALGIEDNSDDRSTSVRHENGTTDLRRRSLLRESNKDAQIRHLDIELPEDEALGEYNWTQSVLMAAGGPTW